MFKKVYYAFCNLFLIKTFFEFLFSEIKWHRRICEKIWMSGDLTSLFIPPKNYSWIEKLLARAPYGQVYSTLDIEFAWYGHSNAILSYAGLKNDIGKKITAEHGVILRREISHALLNNYRNKLIFTFSSERAVFLDSHGLLSHAIGPYIHYAEVPISRSLFIELKKKLGRVAVHFPTINAAISHSNFSNEKYEVHIHEKSICKLLHWKNIGEIDSVIICLRWVDVLRNGDIVNLYTKQGFAIACCGTILNPYYMNHLKMLIQLSKFTTSNFVSTPLGYSFYLGKPHFIIGNEESHVLNYGESDEVSKFLHESLLSTQNNDNIDYPSKEVLDVISKNWGYSDIKNQNELNSIISDFIKRK